MPGNSPFVVDVARSVRFAERWMVDAKSTAGVIVRPADAGRRAVPQPILVGSARHRVAIQRRRACEHARRNFAATV
ncbi:MAG TPA: hypothetical protein VFG42_07160 [Baekduia sp.]|uniref:hypothetical protein n=1 Tax=Baekduia sp. TaxID=2600305 RepID=UPI002D7789DE|nr:hypothetical protein [Baekduia sp.]HET6506549.1 hypothetical protein [Baekduia sp.]